MEFDVKEIAKWLEQSVKDMQESEWSGCWYELDNGLGICIYWADGWGDEPRDDVIQDKEHPDYGLVCGIKVLDKEDQSGSGPYYWNFPYFENGDVATEDTGILPNEDFEKLAKQMLDDFNSVKDFEIDEKGLIHKEAKPEENTEVETESLKEGEDLEELKKEFYAKAKELKPLKDKYDSNRNNAKLRAEVLVKQDELLKLQNKLKDLGVEVKIEESLKEDIHGGDVIDDLVDRAQSMLNSRDYGDADDCVRQAIDDGLIYTADILALLEYYGSIDDSTIIDSYYEELFSDILDKLEEPEEEEEEDEVEEDEWEDEENLGNPEDDEI